MKKTARILSAIFAAAMILTMLASCADSGKSDVTTAAAESTTAPEVTDELYLDREKDNLPDDLKFGGDEVKVLTWNAERDEFNITEDDDDSNRVISAIKARNEIVQERLGIKFVWEEKAGDNGERSNFAKYVENQYQGGNYYDIIATYSRTSAMLSTRGYLKDLNKTETSYLDFNQNWWPDTVIDTCTINNALYFVSGDISTNTLHFLYGIYYNKDLAKEYNIGNLSDVVLSGDWTIDKLISISSDVYQDLNNNAKQDDTDFYGFCTIYYHVDAFYTGSDLMLVDHDPVQTLVISPDFDGEKCVNLVSQLGAWLTTDSCFVSRDLDKCDYQKPFADGNALFCQNRVYMADDRNGSKLNEVTWSYGILPTPKYNSEQKDYITVMGNPFTLYGIGNGTREDARNTAVLECWASEAYRRTTPAIFEVNMKMRYSKDAEDAKMFDILRNTARYDLGRIFSNDLSYMSELPSKAATNNKNWKTISGQYIKILKKSMSNIVADFEKVASSQ